MLELLAHVDIMALPVWAAFLLAASMYPLGFMLGGSCSACCCRTDTCEGFDLEEAFSRRYGGTEYCELFTKGPDLLSLAFSTKCFGSGAAGTIAGPGDDVGKGPLISVTITNGGGGYAIYGRRSPTLSISNASSVAATATVTLANKKDACDVDYWQVESASVTSGGRGYVNGQSVVFSLSPGDVEETKASATLVTKNVEPTLTATASPGSGASFGITLASNSDTPETWGVSSVSVSGTTSGYMDGDTLDFSGTGVTVGAPAVATIRTIRTEPSLSATASGGSGATFSVTTSANGTNPETWSVAGVSVTSGGTGYAVSGVVSITATGTNREELVASALFYSGRTTPTVAATVVGDGSGASLSTTLSQYTDYEGRPYWTVTGVTIDSPGSGYSEWQEVSLSATDGEGYGGYVVISSVDQDGGITGVDVYDGGEFYKSTGVIESVSVFDGGSFFGDTGEIDGVTLDYGGSYYVGGVLDQITVTNGGKYYHPDKTLTPYVRPPTVTVLQSWPSGGSGAEVAATVGDDTSSNAFGMVTGLTLANPGSNYLAWKYISDFEYLGEGKFAFLSDDPGSSWSRPSKGCWVSGDGIAFGARVTEGSWEVLQYEEPRTWTGRYIVTVEPPPVGDVTCVKFCGGSGLCGPFPSTQELSEGYGPYGSDANAFGLRRMCVRWLCRCYEGTGKRGQVDEQTGEPLFPDPYSWYTVESSTIVGGPLVFDGTLEEKLEAAETNMFGYPMLEHDELFGISNWSAADGESFCRVYAFVFYGQSADSRPNPKTVTPRDTYTIHPCSRCD